MSTAFKGKGAVILMAYGSPSSLDDVEAYFTRIRGGKKPSAELISHVAEKYRAVGGKTPLTEITFAQATALQHLLAEESVVVPVYVGMKHWHPFIIDAVEQMRGDGIEEAVAIALAPHYSQMSVGGYERMLKDATEKIHPKLRVKFIRSWHGDPLLLRCIAEQIEETIAKFPEILRESIPIICTAHSLPERIRISNDPYEEELRETVRLIAECFPTHKVHFAFQSAGHTPEPWLGPDVSELIEYLGRKKERFILICPIGFVADHLEILYDIDIVCKHAAARQGITLIRTESRNTHPLFIKSLGNIVLSG